jgi:hypothetical protein
VLMTHLMQAAPAEYIKLERPFTDSEIGGGSGAGAYPAAG